MLHSSPQPTLENKRVNFQSIDIKHTTHNPLTQSRSFQAFNDEKNDDEYSDPSIMLCSDDENIDSCNDDEDDECIASDFELPEDFEIQPFQIILQQPIVDSNNDIVLTLQKEEAQNTPKPGQIENIQGKKIREYYFYLADWLFNLTFFYPTSTETLHQAFALLNKHLTKNVVKFHDLQLIACCCFWICGKVDLHAIETLEPLLKSCHNKYTREDFVRVEGEILESVDYKIESTTSNFFLRKFLEKVNVSKNIADVAAFLCSSSLMLINLSCIRPSVKAYSALLFAARFLSNNESIDLSPLGVYVSHMKESEITICLNSFFKCSKSILPVDKYGCVKKFLKMNNDESVRKTIIAATGLFKSPNDFVCI